MSLSKAMASRVACRRVITLTRQHRMLSTQSYRSAQQSSYRGTYFIGAGIASALAFTMWQGESLHADTAKRKSFAERLADVPPIKIIQRAITKDEDEAEDEDDEEKNDDKQEEKEENKNEIERKKESPVANELEDLSEEADQQSAFDPETNTINWDCPCLGGMAHGPCGEQFKEAFSCFVFSEAEPKGIDCVEKFKNMQDCFRKHPDHYKEELEDEDEEGDTIEGASNNHDKQQQQQQSSISSKANSQEDDEDEDEGVKEWKAEMAKEKGSA